MERIRLVTFIMLAFFCQYAVALDGGSEYYTEVNGIYYKFNKERHHAFVECKASHWAAGGIDGISYNYTSANYSGDIVIQDNVEYEGENYVVVAIDNEAFFDCTIESLTIPASITYIGSDQSLFNIDKVYIQSWEWWNSLSQHGIVNLANHVYVEGNEYDMVDFKVPDCMIDIKDGTFKDFTKMKRFTFPNTTKTIGESAFENCIGLEEIILPDNVEKIGKECFKGCTNVQRLSIGDGLEMIPSEAFLDNKQLEEITVGKKVIKIENNAFSHGNVKKVIVRNLHTWCENLSTTALAGGYRFPEFQLYTDDETMLVHLFVPDGVKMIHEKCFSNQQQLQSVLFPSSLETIGNHAFSYCNELREVKIGDGVKTIGDYAFYKCRNIETLDLGSSVEQIGSEAFGSPSTNGVVIPTVIARMKAPYPLNENVFCEQTYRSGTLYVPTGLKEVYSRFDGWRNFLNIKELSEETPNICRLTVQDAEGGSLSFHVEKNSTFTLAIEPKEDWQIHSITFNDQDMTDRLESSWFTTPVMTDDAILRIVYEKVSTGIQNSTVEDAAHVKVVQGGISISVNGNQSLSGAVYAMDGTSLLQLTLSPGSHFVPLLTGRTYIIRIGHRSLKATVF